MKELVVFDFDQCLINGEIKSSRETELDRYYSKDKLNEIITEELYQLIKNENIIVIILSNNRYHIIREFLINHYIRYRKPDNLEYYRFNLIAEPFEQ